MLNQTPRHSSTKHTTRQGTINSKIEHWDYTTEETDLEQLQQMPNMEEQIHRQESPKENYRSPLNL